MKRNFLFYKKKRRPHFFKVDIELKCFVWTILKFVYFIIVKKKIIKFEFFLTLILEDKLIPKWSFN